MLNNPSYEQQIIIDQIENNNIIVDAVAGSGKTTTILHIALKYNKFNILIITYNTKLRIETSNRIQELNLKNIEIQTYHGFCTKYYQNCRTDNQINNILKSNIKNRKKFKYDLLILDEAQDITITYFELLCKIINDNNGIQHICILGDKNQSIFDFNKADSRFITLADKLFNFNDLSWIKCELSTSYRLTHEMSKFMNDCILQENRVVAQKNGPKVKYIICNTFREPKPGYNYIPFNEVMRYLNNYSRDDIFILGPSVKSEGTPIRNLANKLTEHKIEIFVPNNDDEKIDLDVIRDKIVFSTFHQVKGLERKVVLVFGVTDNYFKYYAKSADPNKCPNTIYVALTRAKECMTLFHHYKDNYCNFIDTQKLKMCTYFYEDPRYKLHAHNGPSNMKEIGATELLKHLPFEIINHAKSYLKITEIQKKSDKIDIKTKVKQGIYYENVSEITGTAIPARFEYINKGQMEIYNALKKNYDVNFPNTIKELLDLSNKYCAWRSGYNYKLLQVNDYNWLNDEQLSLATDRLNKHISKNANYEKKLEYTNLTLFKNNKKSLSGVIDCIDGNKVWEFKCVNELDENHILQLGIYAFLLYHNNLQKKNKLIENLTKYDTSIYNFIENEIITFQVDNNILIGNITKKFKNGNMNVKDKNKTYKINRSNIIKINIVDEKIKEIEELEKEKEYEFYLFNVLDNQILKIETEYNKLKEMVEYLIQKKYEEQVIVNNEKFIENIIDIKNKYFSNA